MGTVFCWSTLMAMIYAYADACPHQKSRLSEGSLIGNTLRCARHHWEFDVCYGLRHKSSECLPEGYSL